MPNTIDGLPVRDDLNIPTPRIVLGSGDELGQVMSTQPDLPALNGRLNVRARFDPLRGKLLQGRYIPYIIEHEGGNIVGVSDDLMRHMDTDYYRPTVEGMEFRLNGYVWKLKDIGHDPRGWFVYEYLGKETT